MSISPSYAPANETSQEIWNEVSLLIGDTVLCSTAFGILVTLYVLCASALIPQVKKRNPNRAWALFHLVYITLLLLLLGVGTSANARLSQQYWINNRNYPGGPSQFILKETSLPVLVWGWSVYIVASWLQDAYVIYRCLVFWNFNYWICGLPLLCFVGSISTSIALIAQISNPSQGLTSPLSINFAICWYIFSVSINVIATIAIVGRLLWKKKAITALLGKEHAQIYTGIAAVLIESAALYSIFGIIFIATYFKQDPVNNIVLPILGTLEGICPLMIIYRILTGRGWTRETVHQLSTMTSLTFKPPFSPAPVINRTPGILTSTFGGSAVTGNCDLELNSSAVIQKKEVVIVSGDDSTVGSGIILNNGLYDK